MPPYGGPVTTTALTYSATEHEFVETVDRLVLTSDTEKLIGLLSEEHVVYLQKSTAATARMRAWILVGFGKIGLCQDSLIYAIEELESGIEPYLVAAAAIALRAYPTKDTSFARYLINAIANIRFHDEPVRFARYGEYSEDESCTAITEILKTLVWLGVTSLSQNDIELLRSLPEFHQPIINRLALYETVDSQNNSHTCCELPSLFGRFAIPVGSKVDEADLAEVLFEDQDGNVVSFHEFFTDTPTIVAFFYTRCDNPYKCSLTVSKLANVRRYLQNQNSEQPISVAAITYDPDFDNCDRVRTYGADRGIVFDSNTRLLRCIRGMDTVRKYFRSGSNFIGTLINRHRIEAFVLDSTGKVFATFQRTRWKEAELIDAALHADQRTDTPVCGKRLDQGSTRSAQRGWRSFFGGFLSMLPPAAVAFFPKCPMCWAAYFSAIGLSGFELPYVSWLYPVLWFFLGVHIISSGLRSKRNGAWASFGLTAAGAGLLVLPFGQWSKLVAICMIGIGSLLGSKKEPTL